MTIRITYIIKVLIKGDKRILLNEILNSFLAQIQATNEVEETRSKPKAVPFTPNLLAMKGTINQVKTVQKTISFKVTLTLPTELKAFTKGVVTTPRAKLAR
jgi:hypothetical protein